MKYIDFFSQEENYENCLEWLTFESTKYFKTCPKEEIEEIFSSIMEIKNKNHSKYPYSTPIKKDKPISDTAKKNLETENLKEVLSLNEFLEIKKENPLQYFKRKNILYKDYSFEEYELINYIIDYATNDLFDFLIDGKISYLTDDIEEKSEIDKEFIDLSNSNKLKKYYPFFLKFKQTDFSFKKEKTELSKNWNFYEKAGYDNCFLTTYQFISEYTKKRKCTPLDLIKKINLKKYENSGYLFALTFMFPETREYIKKKIETGELKKTEHTEHDFNLHRHLYINCFKKEDQEWFNEYLKISFPSIYNEEKIHDSSGELKTKQQIYIEKIKSTITIGINFFISIKKNNLFLNSYDKKYSIFKDQWFNFSNEEVINFIFNYCTYLFPSYFDNEKERQEIIEKLDITLKDVINKIKEFTIEEKKNLIFKFLENSQGYSIGNSIEKINLINEISPNLGSEIFYEVMSEQIEKTGIPLFSTRCLGFLSEKSNSFPAYEIFVELYKQGLFEKISKTNTEWSKKEKIIKEEEMKMAVLYVSNLLIGEQCYKKYEGGKSLETDIERVFNPSSIKNPLYLEKNWFLEDNNGELQPIQAFYKDGIKTIGCKDQDYLNGSEKISLNYFKYLSNDLKFFFVSHPKKYLYFNEEENKENKMENFYNNKDITKTYHKNINKIYPNDKEKINKILNLSEIIGIKINLLYSLDDKGNFGVKETEKVFNEYITVSSMYQERIKKMTDSIVEKKKLLFLTEDKPKTWTEEYLNLHEPNINKKNQEKNNKDKGFRF